MAYKLVITNKGRHEDVVICDSHLEAYLFRLATEGYSTLSVSNAFKDACCCICEARGSFFRFFR